MTTPSDDSTRTCPKCSGAMQMGTIPDFGHGRIYHPSWIQGQIQIGFWGNLKNPQYPIQACRCEKCGYLEQYAPSVATRTRGFRG